MVVKKIFLNIILPATILLCLALSVVNSALEAELNPVDGSFALRNIEGDSSIESDDYISILNTQLPYRSHATIQIDRLIYRFGNSMGDFIQSPKSIGLNGKAVWLIDDIRTQQEIKLNGNFALVTYTIVNTGNEAKEIGLRIFFDTDLGESDTGYFIVPDTGKIYLESVFIGNKVPDFWYSLDNVLTPHAKTICMLNVPEYPKPDKILFACGQRIYESRYMYYVQEKEGFKYTRLDEQDTGFAAYWNKSPLQPGESRSYAVMQGIYPSSIHTESPFAISAYLGRAFNKSALCIDIQNIEVNDMNNVTLNIQLPAGLCTDSGATSILIGKMKSNEVVNQTWLINGDIQPGIVFTIKACGQYRSATKTTIYEYTP